MRLRVGGIRRDPPALYINLRAAMHRFNVAHQLEAFPDNTTLTRRDESADNYWLVARYLGVIPDRDSSPCETAARPVRRGYSP